MFTHKRFFLSNMKKALLELALSQSFVDLFTYWIKTPRFSVNILMASLVNRFPKTAIQKTAFLWEWIFHFENPMPDEEPEIQVLVKDVMEKISD